MKGLGYLLALTSLSLATHLTASSQEQDKEKNCSFNIVGTWRANSNSHASATLVRFLSNGTAVVLQRNTNGQGAAWQRGESSTYELDNPKAPTEIHLSPANRPKATTSMEITRYDDGTFTTSVPSNADVELTRWTRIDRWRYFVVLAAAKGTPGYGAPAFAILIKTDGRQAQDDAFGLYEIEPVHHHVRLGEISDDIQRAFANEPKADSAALFRLEVTAGPYQRALTVLKTWERRAREHTLLYDIPYLDNAVYLNQLAGSLNDCGETIKLDKLTWRIDDQIISKQNLPQVPYFFIQSIRQRNQDLHIADEEFHKSWLSISSPPAK